LRPSREGVGAGSVLLIDFALLGRLNQILEVLTPTLLSSVLAQWVIVVLDPDSVSAWVELKDGGALERASQMKAIEVIVEDTVVVGATDEIRLAAGWYRWMRRL
jgi:hypothetical protein